MTSTSTMLLATRVSEALLFLAVTAAGMVAIAYLADRLTPRGIAKRRIWRVTAVGLLLTCLLELCGLNSTIKQLWRLPSAERFTAQLPEVEAVSSGFQTPGQLPISREQTGVRGPWVVPPLQEIERPADPLPAADPDDYRPLVSHGESAEFTPSIEHRSRDRVTAETESRLAWLPWVWGGGSILMLLQYALQKFRLLRLSRRAPQLQKGELRARVEQLAQRLGVRKVCIRQEASIASPMACGIVTPTLFIPTDFSERFDRHQQGAILSHELAHLSSSDPKWQLLTVAVAALLWWHPLVWIASRRSRLVLEFAADEAAVLVPQGPSHLAECLVAVGRQLTRRPRWELGMAGPSFRSALGARVERLVALAASPPKPPTRRMSACARCQPVFLSILFLCVLSAGWSLPREPANHEKDGGTKMQLIKRNWQHSLAVTLAASVLAPLPAIAQDDVFGDAAADFVVEEEVFEDAEADAEPVVSEEREERRVRQERRLGDRDSERREELRRRESRDLHADPHVQHELEHMIQPQHEALMKTVRMLEQQLRSLPNGEAFEGVRERMEKEMVRVHERLEKSRSQLMKAGQLARSSSRHALGAAAVANLRAAGMPELAERVAAEIEQRLQDEAHKHGEDADASTSDRFGFFGASGDDARPKLADRVRPAPAAAPRRPTPPQLAQPPRVPGRRGPSQPERMEREMQSMKAEMAEIRELLKELMERRD